MVHLMPLPLHHLLLQENPEWFTFLVPAYPGYRGKKADFGFVIISHLVFHHTTTTVLRTFFRDHPGEPVPEENFWTL